MNDIVFHPGMIAAPVSTIVNARLSDLRRLREQATVMELWEAARLVNSRIKRTLIEGEIQRRIMPTEAHQDRRRHRDAWSVIIALRSAMEAERNAAERYSMAYQDTAFARFDGSYSEFEQARLNDALDASEHLDELFELARQFPEVSEILTTIRERDLPTVLA